MIQFSGTVTNMVKNIQMDNKWMIKKREINQGDLQQMTAVERMVYDYENQCEQMRENEDNEALYYKALSGRQLTPEEETYLKNEEPTLYQDYLEAKAERESYRRRIRECETKEDVEKLKLNELSKFMNQVKKVASNPNIPKSKKLEILEKLLQRTSNIQEEHAEFVKTARYNELPDDLKEKEEFESGGNEQNEDVENESKPEEATWEGMGEVTGEDACEVSGELTGGTIGEAAGAASGKPQSDKVQKKPETLRDSKDKGAIDKDFEKARRETKAVIREVKSEIKEIDFTI